MKDLKLITIDFWNTLFDSINHDKRYKFRNSVLVDEATKLGYEIEGNKLEAAIKESWAFFEHNWVNKLRTPNSQELVKVIWEHLNLPNEINSINTVIKTYEDSLFEHPPVLIEGVKEALPKLKERYKLGLISDTGYSPGTHLRQLMKHNEILEYFDSFSFSNETGVSKPHEKAFTTILNELRITPKQSLHIGDIERTDIVGANQTGMHSVLYTGTDSEFDRKNPEVTSANIQIEHWKELLEHLDI